MRPSPHEARERLLTATARAVKFLLGSDVSPTAGVLFGIIDEALIAVERDAFEGAPPAIDASPEHAQAVAALAAIDELIPGDDDGSVVERVRAYVNRRTERAMLRAERLDDANLHELRDAYRESDEANERQREIIECLRDSRPALEERVAEAEAAVEGQRALFAEMREQIAEARAALEYALPIVEKWTHTQGDNAEFIAETLEPIREALAALPPGPALQVAARR